MTSKKEPYETFFDIFGRADLDWGYMPKGWADELNVSYFLKDIVSTTHPLIFVDLAIPH